MSIFISCTIVTRQTMSFSLFISLDRSLLLSFETFIWTFKPPTCNDKIKHTKALRLITFLLFLLFTDRCSYVLLLMTLLTLTPIFQIEQCTTLIPSRYSMIDHHSYPELASQDSSFNN